LKYDSLRHFNSRSPWDEQALCQQLAKDVNRCIGGFSDTALIIDPSSFPKKGNHSVGVARQWSGRQGKIDNCQIGVFSALSRENESCLIDKRLYLPKHWCEDTKRCDKAGIPVSKRTYKSTAELALDLIESADDQGLQYEWIGLDGEFGKQPWFIRALAEKGKDFVIDVHKHLHIYLQNPKRSIRYKDLPGSGSLRSTPKSIRIDVWAQQQRKGWKSKSLREGTKGTIKAKFISRTVWFWEDKEKEPLLLHLIIRKEQAAPNKHRYKYSLCRAPFTLSLRQLAKRQGQRYWVEQAIKDAKKDAGMADYQSRGWKAWHHHVALSLLACLFMLEIRLKKDKTLVKLSNTDIREILQFLLPIGPSSIQQLFKIIYFKHLQRIGEYCNDEIQLE